MKEELSRLDVPSPSLSISLCPSFSKNGLESVRTLPTCRKLSDLDGFAHTLHPKELVVHQMMSHLSRKREITSDLMMQLFRLPYLLPYSCRQDKHPSKKRALSGVVTIPLYLHPPIDAVYTKKDIIIISNYLRDTDTSASVELTHDIAREEEDILDLDKVISDMSISVSIGAKDPKEDGFGDTLITTLKYVESLSEKQHDDVAAKGESQVIESNSNEVDTVNMKLVELAEMNTKLLRFIACLIACVLLGLGIVLLLLLQFKSKSPEDTGHVDSSRSSIEPPIAEVAESEKEVGSEGSHIGTVSILTEDNDHNKSAENQLAQRSKIKPSSHDISNSCESSVWSGHTYNDAMTPAMLIRSQNTNRLNTKKKEKKWFRL